MSARVASSETGEAGIGVAVVENTRAKAMLHDFLRGIP